MQADEFSITFRLRRIRTESAHVSVPITPDLLCPGDNGSELAKLDLEKALQVALVLGLQDSVEWQQEGEVEIQLHPLQAHTGSRLVQN